MKKQFVIITLFCLIASSNILGQNSSCNIHIIPSDTTIYSSSSVQVQLNTDVQADYYAWKPNNNITDTTLRNPIVTVLPNSSNQYILQAMFTDSVNLVTNGNFEQGNTGFTSNYSLGTSPLQEGEYGISNYGPNLHQNFSPCSHDGNFMAGNAYTSPNKIFFQSNTITVQPNTNYLFSIDYTEIDSNTTRPLNQLAIFKFTINDVQINSNDTVVNSPCVWKTYSKVWNSGNNTTATIKVYDVNIIQWANDFAIDNVSLKKLCMAYDTININVVSPTACQIHIIPNDTTIYSNSSVQVQLNTDVQADYYAWKPNSNISDTTLRNPIVTVLPNSSNQYILQAIFTDSVNLVTNGDFEQGNTGFTSSYTYTTQPFVNTTTGFRSDFYSIVSNTNSINHLFNSCTNGGNFFIADGSPLNNRVAYSTTVMVQPNTNYIFSCDELNISSSFPNNEQPELRFLINNNQLAPAFIPNTSGCNWGSFHYIWNSGNNSSATLSIIDSNTIIEGNDFAIDNISLKKLCMAYDTINIIVTDTSFAVDTITDYLCKGETYTNYNLNTTQAGYYDIHYATTSGLDSLLVLHLIEITPFVDSVYAEIYRGDTCTLYGFNAFNDGTYTNTYQDIYGCDSSYVLTLKVIQLMFPNVVTANNDGINDVFEIHDLLDETLFTENELTIYSRYGKQVYHKKNIKTKGDFWNPNSTNSPTGSYFYRFKAKGKTKNIDFNGSIEVIR